MKILLFILLLPSIAIGQEIKIGDKLHGGIVFEVKKNKGFVVALKEVGTFKWDDGLKACDTLTEGGYDDWYMPNLSEIEQLYYALHRSGIHTFSPGLYWSRRQNDGYKDLAWCFDFGTGIKNNSHSKNSAKVVLAIREYKLK